MRAMVDYAIIAIKRNHKMPKINSKKIAIGFVCHK